jgi:D-alanyl-D-alanine dipeptidase
LVKAGILVALPNTDAVKPAPSLPANRRYALPRTVFFLLSLSEAYRQQFGKALTVDSAVRPKSVQERLRRTNRAAAPVNGETASSHESGTTFDLSKKMPRGELQWLRNVLSYEVAMNHVIVEDERNCLHVMVLGGTE